MASRRRSWFTARAPRAPFLPTIHSFQWTTSSQVRGEGGNQPELNPTEHA
jgi:hypothetical protein